MVLGMLGLIGVAAAGADSLPAPLEHAKAGQLGEVLVGPTGMTLYTFANDKEAGKSACNGPCAENWPPFKPAASAPAPKAPLSIITRDDGAKQYAYKGKPLYYWKNDKKAGDATGHGMNNVWTAAKP
jgi:predicted lipoprotein with Yx(FWY)xxD motif